MSKTNYDDRLPGFAGTFAKSKNRLRTIVTKQDADFFIANPHLYNFVSAQWRNFTKEQRKAIWFTLIKDNDDGRNNRNILAILNHYRDVDIDEKHPALWVTQKEQGSALMVSALDLLLEKFFALNSQDPADAKKIKQLVECLSALVTAGSNIKHITVASGQLGRVERRDKALADLIYSYQQNSIIFVKERFFKLSETYRKKIWFDLLRQNHDGSFNLGIREILDLYADQPYDTHHPLWWKNSDKQGALFVLLQNCQQQPKEPVGLPHEPKIAHEDEIIAIIKRMLLAGAPVFPEDSEMVIIESKSFAIAKLLLHNAGRIKGMVERFSIFYNEREAISKIIAEDSIAEDSIAEDSIAEDCDYDLGSVTANLENLIEEHEIEDYDDAAQAILKNFLSAVNKMRAITFDEPEAILDRLQELFYNARLDDKNDIVEAQDCLNVDELKACKILSRNPASEEFWIDVMKTFSHQDILKDLVDWANEKLEECQYLPVHTDEEESETSPSPRPGSPSIHQKQPSDERYVQ